MKVLHVGCGREPLPAWISNSEETRLDIEPAVEPHIVASMTDLGEIGTYDLVYSAHALEHLYPQDVEKALREFRRVLAPGGGVVLFVPDLEDVKPTEEILYESPAGPVCGLDMIYGMRSMIEKSPFMAHHCGFTADSLKQAMQQAGFSRVETQRLSFFNLMGAACA